MTTTAILRCHHQPLLEQQRGKQSSLAGLVNQAGSEYVCFFLVCRKNYSSPSAPQASPLEARVGNHRVYIADEAGTRILPDASLEEWT